MTIAVVTDSTAYLPSSLVSEHGITVVPLHVIVGGQSYAEGIEISNLEVAEALRSFTPVSTSKPSPGDFLDVYERLAAEGHDSIVSIHLSGSMSATVSSAQLAARESPIPVSVVDSRSLGMAMGFAVVSAAKAAAKGKPAAVVQRIAEDRAAAATVMFYVDTLEHLRRGGRIGRASALFGSTLAIKPLLQLVDGQIEPLERVRTSSKALARMEERTVAAVDEADAPEGFDIAVHHLDSKARAEELADRIDTKLDGMHDVQVVELGAVVGAHVGPGTLAVSASPRPSAPPPVIGAATL